MKNKSILLGLSVVTLFSAISSSENVIGSLAMESPNDSIATNFGEQNRDGVETLSYTIYDIVEFTHVPYKKHDYKFDEKGNEIEESHYNYYEVNEVLTEVPDYKDEYTYTDSGLVKEVLHTEYDEDDLSATFKQVLFTSATSYTYYSDNLLEPEKYIFTTYYFRINCIPNY